MAKYICPWWLAYTFDNPFRKLVHNPVRMLSPYVTPGMVVADIGCGMGFFSIGLAMIVGKSGRVLAVDLQEEMFKRVRKRAAKAGVTDIVRPRICSANSVGLDDESLDFGLAFWMVHETPDAGRFYDQMFAALRTSGKLLVAEPKFHVSRKAFELSIHVAQEKGFRIFERPDVFWSYGVVMEKES
ncbi:class I SAM-dependent methyltransferase [Thermodesulfobacteriota bacterium]